MFRTFSICTALALGSFAGQAMAQDASIADDDRLGAAWEALIREEGSFLPPLQMASLNSLAFQAAGVRVCDDHKLDHDVFAERIGAIVVASDMELADEQAEQRMAVIMVAFGARYGIFLSEASLQPERFCTAVSEARKADNGAPVVLK